MRILTWFILCFWIELAVRRSVNTTRLRITALLSAAQVPCRKILTSSPPRPLARTIYMYIYICMYVNLYIQIDQDVYSPSDNFLAKWAFRFDLWVSTRLLPMCVCLERRWGFSYPCWLGTARVCDVALRRWRGGSVARRMVHQYSSGGSTARCNHNPLTQPNHPLHPKRTHSHARNPIPTSNALYHLPDRPVHAAALGEASGLRVCSGRLGAVVVLLQFIYPGTPHRA